MRNNQCHLLMLSAILLGLFACSPAIASASTLLAQVTAIPKSYVFEGIVIGLFIGIALFAVCKSSNRA